MNPITSYHTIDVAYPYRLRGPGNQQNNTDLLWALPTSRDGGTGTPYLQSLGLGYFGIHNRSGGSIIAGVGVRIPNGLWIAGQWVDIAGTPFTDDTADAQDIGATDFALETTTNDDGFVVASRVPFNAISIDIGTASAGAGDPVRAVRYSNTAGDGWTNFANLLIQDGAAADLALTGTTIANEALIVWNVPLDWGQIQAAGLSGITGGYYAINVRATTAPVTTAAVADSLSIYRIYFLVEDLIDNKLYEWGTNDVEWHMPNGDALVALFSTANNQNMVRVAARVRG